MYSLSRIVESRLKMAALCVPLAAQFLAAQQTSIRTVKVHGSKDSVEIEVEASDRIVPQTQGLTGPDRLVVDFPNATPGGQLRSQSVDRGEVKDLRVGLFQSKPPVTRVVLDLRSAQSYQVFPSGRTVIIKVLGGGAPGVAASVEDYPRQPATRPGLVVANYTTRVEPVQVEEPPKPKLEISYRDGQLGIKADKVTLSEVLYAIQQRTGADISIAAGAEQERVVAEIEPGPAPEVLARLLNGSKFNLLIMNSSHDPRQLDRVILTARPEGSTMPLPSMRARNPATDDDDDRPAPVQAKPAPSTPVQNTPRQAPEVKAPADDNTPDQ